MKRTQDMIDAVTACYDGIVSVAEKWDSYRRMAGAKGEQTKPLPGLPEILRMCTDTIGELKKRKAAMASKVYGNGILQVDICSADGKRRLKAVLGRPNERHPNPTISRAAYNALTEILGDGLYADSAFDIEIDDGVVTVAKMVPRK